MGKRVVPSYPAGDGGFSSTVAVRLSASEAAVLSYMCQEAPGNPSAGGLLRSIFRGVARPAGLVMRCGSVKELRGLLQKKSLLDRRPGEEVPPGRLVVLMEPGRYTIKAPIKVSPGLDFVVLGAPSSSPPDFPTVFIFHNGAQEALDMGRFYSCQCDYVGAAGS